MPVDAGSKRLPLPIALAFGLLAAMLIASLALAALLSRYTVEAGTYAEYRRTVTDATSSLRAMESSQRGYLLTRNPESLGLYRELEGEVEGLLLRLPLILPERGTQTLRTLRPLYAFKLGEMKATLDLPPAEALALVRTDRGEATMRQIRAITLRERAWASAATASVIEHSHRALLALTLGLALGGLAVVALSLLWLRQARRQLATVEVSRSGAEAALTALRAEVVQREAAEGRVRQLQKIESLGQLTGGIAHDFNNMLAVVIGGIELARRRLRSDPDKADTSLEHAREGAARAATLTARLLAFSRNQPLAPAPLDLNKLLGGMCDMLGRTLGDAVEVECVYAAGLWRCYADPSEVENAVLNLAINARDAMPTGGKLTIETANAHIDDGFAASRADVAAGQYVLICVSDTGVGMTTDVIDRAFDPFFTTKPVGKGTGLGLSQVFGFVKQSGGHVALYSEVGQGTTIKLYLPRYEGVARDVAPAAPAAAVPEGSRAEVILVVEDEQRLRQFAVDALGDLGYTALCAASPAEALGVVGAHPEITLLFTDIVMPEMTGRELADCALALRPDLKVLFTTGYTRNAIVHNGMVDVGVAFLAKPYGIGELARKIRSVLDGGGVNRSV